LPEIRIGLNPVVRIIELDLETKEDVFDTVNTATGSGVRQAADTQRAHP